jgi:phenylalanyl-tRNA synthetase beta chain
MKITHSGLQKLIPLPEDPTVVAGWLTGLGLEVESLEPVSRIEGNLEGLVLGTVLTCEKHPDAERLRVTQVSAGQEEPLSIVCGAPNVAAGQRVVVALTGATLYPLNQEPFTIKKARIRGVASEGMICAEDETGLGSSHDGIMVLNTDMPDGTPAARYFNLEPDQVYEIGLTPNRIDAASHYGVARDLKALLNRAICFPEVADWGGKPESPFQTEVQEPEWCRRYAALQVDDVRPGPSPEWLQQALKSLGLSPINNVVDITNYVMYELGQPLHAFDAGTLQGKTLIVRRAAPGETLTLLDKTERTLSETDLVIADSVRPLALAGIMGGLESGVGPQTRTVWLESAWFEPSAIRKSAQRHSLRSDSAFRFERGTDPEMVPRALARAARLLEETGAAGKISFAPVVKDYNVPAERTFVVKWRNFNRLTGFSLPRETVYAILENLDIKTTPLDSYGHPGFEEEFSVTVPAYRVDVEREADIVEEVLRVYGLENLPDSGYLQTGFISPRAGSRPEKRTLKAATLLADMGFTEIVTNSLTHPGLTTDLTGFPEEEMVRLLNPLSEELSAMRQTLLFSGLEAMAWNLNRRQSNLKLFETGKTYRKTANGQTERYVLGLWVCGLWQPPSWECAEEKTGYFHLRKTVENLLTRLGYAQFAWKDPSPAWLEYGQTLMIHNQPAGTAGLVREELCRKKDVKVPVFYAELDWEKLRQARDTALKTRDVPRFPEVVRDLSVVLDLDVPYSRVDEAVRQTGKKLIRSISVFDVYQGDKIESGKKAYALSIVLQDEEQTLTENRIEGVMNQIMQRLETDLKGIIRR